MSNLIDAMLHVIFYKGRPGDVYFMNDDDDGVADLVVRNTTGGYITVPFKMENGHLGRRIQTSRSIERSVILSIFSQAVMDDMRPVGIMIDRKIHSPYTHVLLDDTALWPDPEHHVVGGQLMDVHTCERIAQATGKLYSDVDPEEAFRRSQRFHTNAMH